MEAIGERIQKNSGDEYPETEQPVDKNKKIHHQGVRTQECTDGSSYKEMTMPITEEKVGQIHNDTLSTICRDSGTAKIYLADTTSHDFGLIWRNIHIIGSDDAIDKAQKILMNFLESPDERVGR